MRVVITRTGNFQPFITKLEGMAARFPAEAAAALNTAGPMIRKATVAAETAQTGLKKGTINRAQHEKKATVGDLSYSITAGGGDVRAKFFKPRETAKGVVAKPWNKATLFSGAFSRGGRFPERKALSFSGVFKRVGAGRLPIKSVHSGLFIPTELVTGQTAAAFDAGAAQAGKVIADRIFNFPK